MDGVGSEIDVKEDCGVDTIEPTGLEVLVLKETIFELEGKVVVLGNTILVVERDVVELVEKMIKLDEVVDGVEVDPDVVTVSD